MLAPSLAMLGVAPAACRQEPTEPRSTLATRWLQPHEGGFEAIRPAAGEGVVYVATHTGFVVARAVADGAERWRVRVADGGAPDGENMALAAGTLVVPVRFHTEGVDVATGRVLWRYRAPPDTTDTVGNSGPGLVRIKRIATDGTTLYLPAWGASVSAVDLRTGQAR